MLANRSGWQMGEFVMPIKRHVATHPSSGEMRPNPGGRPAYLKALAAI
jgi:hypothetical protein